MRSCTIPPPGPSPLTGSLNTARADHTATLLNNGMVLMAGGYDSSGVTLASAELYNPATGTFTPTGSLNTARDYHTATLLNNGMVLMAGGDDASGTCLASAELYNPATGTFTPTGSLNTARDVSHGDAAEQRHGADGGRLSSTSAWCPSQCGAVRTGHADAAEPRVDCGHARNLHVVPGDNAAVHRHGHLQRQQHRAACLGDLEFVGHGCGADQQRCEQSRSEPCHRRGNRHHYGHGRERQRLGHADRAPHRLCCTPAA